MERRKTERDSYYVFKIAIRLERSLERKAGYPIPGEEETNYIASALDRVGEHPRKNRDVKPALLGTMSFGLLLRAGVKGSYHEAGKSEEEEEPEEEEARNAHTHIPHASFPSPSSCVWRFALVLRAPPPPPPDPLSLQSSLTYSPTPTFLLFPFDAGVTERVSVFCRFAIVDCRYYTPPDSFASPPTARYVSQI